MVERNGVEKFGYYLGLLFAIPVVLALLVIILLVLLKIVLYVWNGVL
jgi:hypothetical protein